MWRWGLARNKMKCLDSARQRPIEALRSERGSSSPSGKGDEKERLDKVAASPNALDYFLTVPWISLALLLALDIGSKILAIEFIPPIGPSDWVYPFGGVGIFSDFLGGISFSLNFAINTGAAWGTFGGYPGLLFGLRAAIIAGIVINLLYFHRGTPLSKYPLWIVVIGAVGNAIDYILYGHVIDFFHFTFWGYSFPIFNFADSFITLGFIGFLLFSNRLNKKLQVL